jgi:hypothetical protein
MRKGIWIAVTAAVLVAGCVAPPKPVAINTRFAPADHVAYMTPGTIKVNGQAFLRQQGGGTVTCAGSRAVLFPATGYFRDSTDILARGGIPDISNNRPGADMKALIRETRCDAQGNFEFEKVAAGRYIVMSEVRWTVANSQNGGFVKREVEVVDGATNRFLLSDTDR